MRLSVLGRILAAQSLSSLGTSISTIALSYMVLKITGSVLQMGGVMAISTFPLVVTSFIGGALLDRFSARNAMILADICRAALIFSLPFMAEQSVALIYVVAGLMGVFSAVFNPGQVKLIGDLADRGSLVRANSYLSVSRDGAELLGYLVGAPLVIALGYRLTFGIDAATYILSALMLVGLPRMKGARSAGPGLGRMLAEAPQVVGAIWSRPALRTNLLLATFASTAIMMSVPNSYGLAFDVFDRGAWGITALEVFTASGMIIGGLIISRFSMAGDKNGYVAFGLVAMGLCFIGVSFSGLFWLSIGLIGLAGMANVTTFVPSMTLFQEFADEERRGRLIAVRAGFGQIGTTGGLMIGGALGALLGIKEAFFVAGIVGVGLTLAIYLPHRILAVRRYRITWRQAIASGVCRRDAAALARAALLGGETCEELVPVPVPIEATSTHGGVGYVRQVAPITGATAAELTLAPAGTEEEA